LQPDNPGRLPATVNLFWIPGRIGRFKAGFNPARQTRSDRPDTHCIRSLFLVQIACHAQQDAYEQQCQPLAV